MAERKVKRMEMFYIVERHISYKDGRHENDIALIDGVNGGLYTSYEAAKQAIVKELVPHSENVKGSYHRTTEHVEFGYGGFTLYGTKEMWRVTTKYRNDYDVEYFVKEAKVAPE